MGPLKDWISNPNVTAGYNAGSAAAGLIGAGLTGSKRQSSTAAQAALLGSMRGPFELALAAQQKAAEDEAGLYDAQAELAQLEANAEAEQKRQEVESFAANQDLAYSSAGVVPTAGIADSWIHVVDRTRKQGAQEIEAIRLRGQATADMLRRRGLVGRSNSRAAILGERQKYNLMETQLQIEAAAEGESARKTGLSSALSALQPLLGTPAGMAVPRTKPNASGGGGKTPKSGTQASPAATPLRGFLPQAGYTNAQLNQLSKKRGYLPNA